MVRKILIDTDPGIDDAFALMFALNYEDFDIQGITTVSGNNSIEKVTRNALQLLSYADREDIKVYKGMDKPLVKEASVDDGCHGKDGLGDINLDLNYGKAEDIHAVDYIIHMADKYGDELEIITLGPLTNIATAIKKNPEAMGKVHRIISMGGGVLKGNVTPVAEFNYWADPEAAKIVYDFTIPIVMVGLNVTEKSLFTLEEFEFMKKLDTKIGNLLFEMQKKYADYHWKAYGIKGCYIHDLLAMVIAADESIANGIDCNVDIATESITRGECLVDLVDAWGKRKNAYVINDFNALKYKSLFFSTIFHRNKEECIKFLEKTSL